MPDDDMVLVRRDDLRAVLVRVSAAGHWDLADDSSFARLLDAVNGEAATVEYGSANIAGFVVRERNRNRFCTHERHIGPWLPLSGSHESPKEQT